MIQPTYGTLQNLFSERVFRIPHYQRFYSWKAKQRRDLFEDLQKLADRGGDNHHFMATIVCHRTQIVKAVGATEYRLYDIVDGQQRLTTLIIIMKAIELSLPMDSNDRTDLQKILVKRDENLILLQSNNSNENILNRFLREGRKPKKDDIETHADRNLQDAIRDCSQFVKEWTADRGDVMSLLRLVSNRLGFVFYDTEDERVVYTIFEVLNSRGLTVDWLDKCKSLLMGRAFELAKTDEARDAAIESLQKLWGNIYKEIAEVDLAGQEILRVAATLHFGSSKSKPLQADEALESFRDACKKPDDPRKLAEALYDITKKLVRLENNVFLGPVTRILHARILAIALESTDALDEKQVKHVLDQWERVTFRIFGLNGKDARTKVGEYVRLAVKIMKMKKEGASSHVQILGYLKTLGADYPIDDAVAEGLEKRNCYEEDPGLCRFVLWRYEEHLANKAGKNATVDDIARQQIWKQRAVDSIEHVFPQNASKNGPWEKKMCRDGEDAQAIWEHIHRIGNLVLLPQSLNSEAQRKGFDDKKKILGKHNLRMIREVIEKDDWTLDEIEARERRICNWAKKEWADL